MAKSSHTYGGITEDIWSCIKQKSQKEHSTVYDPPNAVSGKSTTKTGVGKVVMEFDFDASKESVYYKVEEKPKIVTYAEIWNGIQKTIDECK